MRNREQERPGQFTLRSLLAGLLWFAMLLAICVQYQQARTRQRATNEMLNAAGVMPHRR
jgi:hypothetical protein